VPGPRRYGEVFDEFAEDYDARRSGYPRELVERAVELAGLTSGSHVVEVGCGTGKLTEELIGCGLRVDAIDPGPNMIELARCRVSESGLVHFHLGRFEAVSLPEKRFEAVFSATAFHWIDPAVGWRKAARLLAPGGTLALVEPIGVRDEADGPAGDELVAAFTRLIPALAAERPVAREPAAILAGVEERRANVSEAWAWLAHPGLAVPEAATLFGPAELTSVPRVIEQTAAELWAVFETTSRYHRLGVGVRAQLQAECERIVDRHGGTLRSTQLVALVTAQRR
jgi:ubiquinone/menaquinone biosynthesis C-methylase UbiE